MRRKLNPKYTVIYAVLGLTLLGVELRGVFGDGSGDTISEHYWWLQDKVPLVWVPMVGLLAWMAYHFKFQDPKD